VRCDLARTLKAVKDSPVPMLLIMGDADKMLGSNWIQALRNIQAPMVIVQGANHFMDAEHEFDLLEHTLDFLQKVPASP
jgi:alpha/beta superfamily hydrolase